MNRKELLDGKAMEDRSTILEDWPSEKRPLETPVDDRSFQTPVDERSLESFAEEASSLDT